MSDETHTTIDESVAILISDPRPVLCLDTCDFLDVVRSFEEKGNTQSQAVRRLINSLNAEPHRVQPVVTFLVRRVWEQNIENRRKTASGHLLETDQRIRRVMDCCAHAEVAVDRPSTDFARLPLVQGLVDLAEGLMSRALVLEQDGP